MSEDVKGYWVFGQDALVDALKHYRAMGLVDDDAAIAMIEFLTDVVAKELKLIQPLDADLGALRQKLVAGLRSQ